MCAVASACTWTTPTFSLSNSSKSRSPSSSTGTFNWNSGGIRSPSPIGKGPSEVPSLAAMYVTETRRSTTAVFSQISYYASRVKRSQGKRLMHLPRGRSRS